VVLYVYVWAVYVLTVWASIRDSAFIGSWHLFETQRLLEVLRYACFLSVNQRLHVR